MVKHTKYYKINFIAMNILETIIEQKKREVAEKKQV
jgi:hypothetical protein